MKQPGRRNFNWRRIRKFVNDIHLWLGLGSGLIVVAICLSGTIYVYNTELSEMAASHLYKVNQPLGVERIAPEQLMGKVQELAGGKVTSVNVPADLTRTYQFSVKKEGDKSRFGTTYMVNPYTGEIVGNSQEKNGTKEFMGTMFSLHRWLLLDRIETPILEGLTNRELGSRISGWATILFTIGCITGLIIWFPQRLKSWRQGLKIKFNGNWKRLNHDLHNSLAFYALFFLLLMGLTGPQWSFPWYRDGLQKTLGTYKPKQQEAGISQKGEKKTKGNSGKESLASTDAAKEKEVRFIEEDKLPNLTAYIATADKQLPYNGNYTISFSADNHSPVTIAKTRVGFFAPAAGDKLTVDPLSASVIALDIFRKKPINERIAGSIKAIHVGTVYGGFTRLLYFLACLIATTLPVTGTLIWLNKLKKKKRKKIGADRYRARKEVFKTAVVGNI